MTKKIQDPEPLPPRGVSRRSFGHRVTLLTAAGALNPIRGVAQNESGLPAAEQAEVDAKFANIIRKYGDRLSEDQRTRVRDVLVRHERMLMRVRAFPLENSDSPATSLRVYAQE